MENLINSTSNLSIPQLFIIRAKFTETNPNLVKKGNSLYWNFSETHGENGFKLDITTNNITFYENHQNIQKTQIDLQCPYSSPSHQIHSFISHWLYRVYGGYIF